MCFSKTALKAFLLVINVLLFLCGAAVMGVGIWAVADKMYISHVVGNSLFSSAAILMVICGAFLILVSFLGCLGAIAAKRVIVVLFIIALVIIFVLLLTAGIVAAVFQDEIDDKMRERMRTGLRERYGFNTAYVEENRDLTDAWDLMQTRLSCCAVDDQGWGLYQQSRWFGQQFSEYNKKFVPPSCCMYEGRANAYVNLENCQSFPYGPPRFSGGSFNPSLHYTGCYTAAKDFIGKQAEIILGIGFSFLVFLIAGIVIGVTYVAKLKEEGTADFRR